MAQYNDTETKVLYAVAGMIVNHEEPKRARPMRWIAAAAFTVGVFAAATHFHLPAMTAKSEPPIVEAPEPVITPELAKQALVTYEEPKQDVAESQAEPALTQDQADAIQLAEYHRDRVAMLERDRVKNEEIRKRYEAAGEGIWGNVKSAVGIEP